MILGAVKSSSDSQRGRCVSVSTRRRERNNQSVVIECQVAGSQHLELPDLWSDPSALTCLWCAFRMVKCSDVRLCFCSVVRPENVIAIGHLMEFMWLGRDCSQNLCTTREFARAGTLYRCQKNAVDLNSLGVEGGLPLDPLRSRVAGFGPGIGRDVALACLFLRNVCLDHGIKVSSGQCL